MSSYECSTDDGASGNDPAKWRKSCLCHCYKGKFFVLKPATATDTVSSLARSISSCGCVIQAASRHSGGDAALFCARAFHQWFVKLECHPVTYAYYGVDARYVAFSRGRRRMEAGDSNCSCRFRQQLGADSTRTQLSALSSYSGPAERRLSRVRRISAVPNVLLSRDQDSFCSSLDHGAEIG
jgi:hypothetical protein